MPTPKQMEKLAAEAARRPALAVAAPNAPLPAEYWEAVLRDPRAGANGAQMRQRRLAEIQRHVLRVSCRCCKRTVEIQTVDAVRLYGGNAIWKDVPQRLLAITRTANLSVVEGEADELIVSDGRVTGIRLGDGRKFSAGAIVITTGTTCQQRTGAGRRSSGLRQ